MTRTDMVTVCTDFSAIELLRAVRKLDSGLMAISLDEGDPFDYKVYEALNTMMAFFKEEIRKNDGKRWTLETEVKKEE